MSRESGAGIDAVSCAGTAAVSMAAWMFAAGRWLLTRWLCDAVGGVRHRWMRLLGQVSGVLGVGRRRKAYSEAELRGPDATEVSHGIRL